jgi:hypothetical protein
MRKERTFADSVANEIDPKGTIIRMIRLPPR